MNLLNHIRKSKTTKVFSVLVIISMFEQLIYPIQAYGLTSGPSQPEVQSFEPIATTQMVDPFTGDFTYNIPLFDVGGYPINISYHSGITMDQEASSVGLGWNINPGSINRQLQGIPDDFKGDVIQYKNNLKPQIGLSASFEFDKKGEAFGQKLPDKVVNGVNITSWLDQEKINYSLKLGIQYHNYRGLGYDIGFGKSLSGPNGIGANFDISFSSFEGYDATAGLSYQAALRTIEREEYEYTGMLGLGLGIGMNSRTGIKNIGLNLSMYAGNYVDKYEGGDTEDNAPKEALHIHYISTQSSSYQGGMSFMTSAPSYQPTNANNTKSASYSFSYKQGLESLGLYAYGTFSASVDWFGNEEKSTSRKTLGSLYLPEYNGLNGSEDYILDYNQIKNSAGQINRFTQNIHQANQTADNYSVTGQGISGSYKLYQGAVGTLHQPKTNNRSMPSGNFDVEWGVGNIAKNGINFRYLFRKGYSGKWRNEYGNLSSEKYSFGAVNGNANQEKVYFKNVGERISVDEDYLNALNRYSPTALEINHGKCSGCDNPINGFAVSSYVTDKLSHNPTSSTNSIVKGKRAERNQLMSHMTAIEAEDFGLTKYVSAYAQDHHVAEINVVGDDGRRYVYGQALYNTKQKEVTFNVAHDTRNDICKPNSTHYNTTEESTLDNDRGKEHLYSSTETPAYAHSYYITAVLSVDYVDVDNNGPTPNDLGDYVLFEYDKVMEDYKWRTPYAAFANGYLGLESNDNDNKASYVYGEKEVWYIKSVRSKNQKAEFIYDKTGRKDSYEVVGEHGGIGTRPLWKLDQINIYTEHTGPTFDATYNPTPSSTLLKTVHFAYSYDLCKNVPNNVGTSTGSDHPLVSGVDQNRYSGKLTLHKIWFTYQGSQLGAESPYLFNYSSLNPDYDPEANDRWGAYKVNDCQGKYNARFPYSTQEGNNANLNASAWNLSQITLPSGGEINLEYESDDYQYVQDRTSMEMFGIRGFGKTASAYKNNSITNNLYSYTVPQNFIFVDIPHEVTTNEEFKEKYLKNIDELYFRIRINMNNYHQTDKNGPNYEYIEGFAKIAENDSKVKNAGITTNSNVGWIQLESVKLKEGRKYETNPIAKTAWQFIRNNMNYLAFPASDNISDPDNPRYTTPKEILRPAMEFINTIRGFNSKMLDESYALETDITKSVVRLNTPDGRKYGGGSRISKISFTDNWSSFDNSNVSSTYSTAYSYTLEDGSSSGVASYEPIIGGEENPFKIPIHYTETPNLLALANHLYDLEPFCEFLYPAAVVGYSRIVTKVELPQDIEGLESFPINRHTNGYTVTEFYTAKEFPTRSSSTTLERVNKGGLKDPQGLQHALASMFGSTVQGITASQGFQIILNDMHGKLKRSSTWNSETNQLVSEVAYEYKVNNEHRTSSTYSSLNPGTGKLELDNEVTVLNPDGSFEIKPIGVDIDAYVDLNENREITHVPGFDWNFDYAQPGVPLIFVIPLPKYRRVENYIVTASMTKVITQSGLLTKVINRTNAYSVETENVAFDAKTGSVLLTKTKNSFDDDIYSMTYPAHWAYDGMGQAYENIGYEFDFTVDDGLGYATEDAGQYLAKGDEIAIPNNPKRYWIFHIEKVDINGTPMYKFGLIDAAGNIKYNDSYHGKVIRSGRRNMQGLAIGQVVSKTNPLNITTNAFGLETDFENVLASSAIEYDENWQTFRGFHKIGYNCVGSVFDDDNPCSNGIRFRENRNNLRMMAINKLCLTDPTFNYNGVSRSICEGTECPPKPYKRNVTGEPKRIPDKSDPTFDKAKTRPSSFGGLMTKDAGRRGVFDSDFWSGDLLLASADNSIVVPSVSFPSCDQFITHIQYDDNSGIAPPDPPNGVFKYKNGSTTFCAEMFTFQYASDVAILGDANQMANMSLNFVSHEVIGGIDYNYYEVVFPAYPGIQAYLWSTCPDCDANPNSGGTGGSSGGSGGTKVIVTPETPPAGNSQGTLPGGENPYILGVYGNWRPKKSYIYYDTRNTYNQRVQSEDILGDFNSTNIREDGVLQSYKIFWNPPAVGSSGWTKSLTVGNQSDPWKWNSLSDQYHPTGYEVQTHDVLGIFNAAYFSPVNRQPYFVVNNSGLQDALAENFEDYWEFYFDADCDQNDALIQLNKVNIDDNLLEVMKYTSFHSNLWTSFNPFAYVKQGEGHTGNKSLFLTNTPHTLANNLDLGNQTPGQINIEIELPDQLSGSDYKIFKPGNEDLIDRFNPEQLEYYVSFWVKEGTVGASVDLKVAGAIVKPVLPLMASPVEGWTKKTYKIVYNSSPLGETLITLSTNKDVYVDDLRIQPINSTMKTFTYDPKYLRLTSTSDENNYATFYEYDLEGNLIRVKRETERGIFTITENGKNIRH